MADDGEITALLREMRDGQREALDLAKSQLNLAQEQAERMNKISENSLRLQQAAVDRARGAILVIAPVVTLLAALVAYLIFKYRLL